MMTNSHSLFKFIFLVTIAAKYLPSRHALFCEDDNGNYNYLNFGNIAQSQCQGDACKVTISYLPNAFRAFPVTERKCVDFATDETSTGIGCGQCDANSLLYALFNPDWYKTCKLTSKDGLSTAYCSQIDKAIKGGVTYTSNTPYIVTSCYQGIFSAETPLQPSACPSNTNSPNGNPLYCLTKWNMNTAGEVSALGACVTNTNTYSFWSRYSVGFARQTCNQDNCNNVLICYVGNYFQIPSDDSRNTMKASLCYLNHNSACKMNIEWSTNNGYTLFGSCQADGVCKEKQVLLTGDENTVGTECCFNQYCNHPSKYSFYSSSSSSIRFTFTLTVIALASIF